jgi:hypothetical protein
LNFIQASNQQKPTIDSPIRVSSSIEFVFDPLKTKKLTSSVPENIGQIMEASKLDGGKV